MFGFLGYGVLYEVPLGFLPQVEIARATLHKSRQLRSYLMTCLFTRTGKIWKISVLNFPDEVMNLEARNLIRSVILKEGGRGTEIFFRCSLMH